MPPANTEAIKKYLSERQQEMTELLERMVRAESPSTSPEAQQKVLTILFEVLTDLGYYVRFVPGHETGGQIFARPRDRVRGRPIQLLLGHFDTVWPMGTIKDMPILLKDGRMTGPGVYDMKAGLVQACYALKALKALNADPDITPVIFFNSDEEIGSRESSRLIRHLARRAARVFVMEPSLGPEGKLKTARKGVGRFSVEVQGKAAHAGLDPESGASAILELSYAIQKLFALNDPARGTTVNVGQIDGGLRPNVVAPTSKAVADVRVLTAEDARRVEDIIRAIQPETPGVSLKIEGVMGRPPLERTPANQALYALAQTLGRELGVELEEGIAGGGSDGSTTSAYTATLDGLGAVGDGAHASHEFVYLDSLVERSALLALLLAAPMDFAARLTEAPSREGVLAPALEGQEP